MHTSGTYLLKGAVCLLWYLLLAKADQYMLVPHNDKVITACTGSQEDLFSKSVDMSHMEFIYYGDVIEVRGYAHVLWKLDPTDNFDFKLEAFKKTGGKYSPTMLNIVRKNGCGALFNEHEKPYELFFSNIVDEDRVCVNHHPEVVWHFNPFNLSMIVDGLGGKDEEGDYKLVINARTYNSLGKMRKEQFCCELLGELVRL